MDGQRRREKARIDEKLRLYWLFDEFLLTRKRRFFSVAWVTSSVLTVKENFVNLLVQGEEIFQIIIIVVLAIIIIIIYNVIRV